MEFDVFLKALHDISHKHSWEHDEEVLRSAYNLYEEIVLHKIIPGDSRSVSEQISHLLVELSKSDSVWMHYNRSIDIAQILFLFIGFHLQKIPSLKVPDSHILAKFIANTRHHRDSPDKLVELREQFKRAMNID